MRVPGLWRVVPWARHHGSVRGERVPVAAWRLRVRTVRPWLTARMGCLLRSRGREKQQVEHENEFWAEVSAIAVSPVAIAAGFAKGAYDASTDNGAFAEGFNAAASPIIKAARSFGDEHGTTITKGVVTGAASMLGARIVSGGLKRIIG